MLNTTFTARVFNSVREALEAVESGKPTPSNLVTPSSYVISARDGGGPAMPCSLGVLWAIKGKNIKDVAIITDGRFSGFSTSYLAIVHICPEAQISGPLAFLKDDDQIRVDIPNRRLDVELSDEELEKRKSKWSPPIPPNLPGVATMYARLALQAD